MEVIELNKHHHFLSFAYLTDTHYGTPENNLISERTCKTLCNEKWLNFAVFGGDMHNVNDKMQANNAIGHIIKEIGDIQIPTFYCKGNHDVNYKIDPPHNELTDTNFYLLYNKQLNKKKAKHDPINPYGNYYYQDFNRKGIRVCILNSNDGIGDEFTMSQTQLDFLENHALATQNKVIVFVHHYAGVQTMLHPIFNRFQANGGILIAVISGHVHRDSIRTEDGYNVITTSCSRNNASQSGTIDEICFDVCTIDTASRTLYMNRVGRGENRHFKY